MIRRLISVAACLLPASVAAQPCETVAQPWVNAPRIAAGADEAALASTRVEIGRPTFLVLKPDGEVAYRSLPQGEGEAASFGGMALVEIPAVGIYRVAIDRPAWIDIVGVNGPAPTLRFGPGAPCSGVRKAVSFQLSPGRYVLEISGSRDGMTGVLIETLAPPSQG